MLACAAFLECKQLFAAVALVVDLGSRLDKVLQVGAGKEVAKVHKFAVVLVFDVDDAPAVGAATDLSAVNIHSFLGANDGEWDDRLAMC